MCLCICIHIDCYFPYCLISLDAEPEQEIIPEAEDTQFDPPQQGKQTPLIMSIKTQFPLILAYACLGCHHVTVLPLVEPIPLHDLSFCHSNKQTTILADLGVA